MVRREYRPVRNGAAALRIAAAAAAGIALAAVVAPSAAEARGFVGFSVGVPLFGPAYYPPPPVVYGPPPAVVYAPPPAAVVPAAPLPNAGAQQGDNCREYQSTVTIDGRPQPTYGRACLQPDGTWRIVQ